MSWNLNFCRRLRCLPAKIREVASVWEETAEDSEGYQSVTGYPDGLLVVRIRGGLRANSHTARVTGRLQRAIGASSSRVQVFFDLEGFTRYESRVRTEYTQAVAKHTNKVDRVYVYASSHGSSCRGPRATAAETRGTRTLRPAAPD